MASQEPGPDFFVCYHRPLSSLSLSLLVVVVVVVLFHYTLSSHTIATFYGKRFSNNTYAVKTINIILPQVKLIDPRIYRVYL